jgi:hypothetical protein
MHPALQEPDAISRQHLFHTTETILSHIPRLFGSIVTNNSTWIGIGYRIYSLWRFITTHRLQLLATDTITHN